MKKDIGPIAMIAAIVIAVGIAGYFLYQGLTGTTPTVHVTGPAEDHPTMNGQKPPPGAPVDYMQKTKSDNAPAGR